MMRVHPPNLAQPDTVWDKRVTFDEEVRKNIPQRVNRKSAVEEVWFCCRVVVCGRVVQGSVCGWLWLCGGGGGIGTACFLHMLTCPCLPKQSVWVAVWCVTYRALCKCIVYHVCVMCDCVCSGVVVDGSLGRIPS